MIDTFYRAQDDASTRFFPVEHLARIGTLTLWFSFLCVGVRSSGRNRSDNGNDCRVSVALAQLALRWMYTEAFSTPFLLENPLNYRALLFRVVLHPLVCALFLEAVKHVLFKVRLVQNWKKQTHECLSRASPVSLPRRLPQKRRGRCLCWQRKRSSSAP